MSGARQRFRRRITLSAARWLAAVIALVGLERASGAEDAAFPRVEELRIGAAGKYQAGRWTPVVARLIAQESFDGVAFLTAVDGDGTPYRVEAPAAIKLGPGERGEAVFYFRPAALENRLGLLFRKSNGASHELVFIADDERAALRVPRALPANERLIVGIGPKIGLATAFTRSQELAGGAHAVELERVADLPTSWLGFDGFDTLFVSTEDAEFNATWREHPQRIAALSAWVRQGGRLVLAIGAQADTVLKAEHPLAPLMPGKYVEQVALLASQTSAWEEYASSPQPLPPLRNIRGEERLRVPHVVGLAGKVEAPANRGADQPALVVRVPYGLGEVVFVAADLGRPPFARWSGRNNLLRRLSRSPLLGETVASNASGHRSTVQYDLVEQLQRALDEFPGVRIAPFLWVTMLVMGYIALVGPIDFSLLRRWGGRMEWTWVTFPLFVALATAGGFWFAGRLKGDQLMLNQVDVIDVDADGAARGFSIANVFSPEARTYELTARPTIGQPRDASEYSEWLSSFAITPGALSGDATRTTVQPLSSDRYTLAAPLDRIVGLPMQVWSSRGVAIEWHGQAPSLVSGRLTLGLDALPEGDIRWEAPWKLEECWIVFGDTVSQLGPLASGEVKSIGARSEFGWSTLSNQLRYQRRVRRSSGQDEFMLMGTQWDPESTDVKEILRQILFYDAAGRSDYTRAWNGPLRKLDLSARRDLGQVQLVGFVSEPAAPDAPGVVLRDRGRPFPAEHSRRWTVVRVLIPVATSPAPAGAAGTSTP